MRKFRRGQLWLVNFDPSFGHEYKKVRPALIVQNNQYIESTNLITVIPISSQTIKKTALDISKRHCVPYGLVFHDGIAQSDQRCVSVDLFSGLNGIPVAGKGALRLWGERHHILVF